MAERFQFGRNWASFLSVLDERRILEAERSLDEMVGREQIANRTFIPTDQWKEAIDKCLLNCRSIQLDQNRPTDQLTATPQHTQRIRTGSIFPF